MLKRNPDYAWIFVIGLLIGFACQLVVLLVLDTSIDRAALIPFGLQAVAIAGAIIVALALESRKRRLDDDQTREMIRDSLSELLISLEQVGRKLPTEGSLEGRRLPLLVALDRLQSAVDLLSFVRRDMKIRDVHLWRSLRAIESQIAVRQSALDHALSSLRELDVTECDVTTVHENLATDARLLALAVRPVVLKLGG